MKEYKTPAEYQPLPPEHPVPEEYPVNKPQQAAKKKGGSRRWMAMIAATFMTMQLMFTYFVPPTDQQQQPDIPDWTEPGWVDPGGDRPQRPTPDFGNFPLQAAPQQWDDQLLRQGLAKAFEKFDQDDYVRASILLYEAVADYAAVGDVYGLPTVCYGYGPNGVVDLGTKDTSYYVYFERRPVQYEEKDGTLVTEFHLGMNMVSFYESEEETYYRVLSFAAPFELINGNYGKVVSYTASYTAGGIRDDASSLWQQTWFEVYDGTNYPNLDDTYSVLGRYSLSGEVKNGAFMKDTILYAALTLDADLGQFENDYSRPDHFVQFSELTDDGHLDFSNYAVVDNRDWTNPEAWDEFNTDLSKKYLAYGYALSIKLFDYEQDPRSFELYDIDFNDPLLPVDMELVFELHTYAQNALGTNPGNGNEDQNNNPLEGTINVMFYQDIADGVLEASNYFLADDYIRTGAYFVECLSEYGVNMLNAFSDSQDAFEEFYGISLYCDGKTISSVTQNGLSGCYFHFEKGSNWWIGNSETKTHFAVMQVTITRVEETAEGTRYRVVQFAVGAGANNPTYVPGALVTDHGDGLRYIEGVFDSNGNSADCEITVFSNAFYNTQINLDGKFAISGVRRLRGSLQNGAFMNGTVLYDNIVYDPAANRLDAVSENGERVISISFLTADGRVDFSNAAVVDNRNVGVDYDAYIDNPALRCLAGNTLLELKYDVESEYYFDLQIHDLDYSKPVFPLDLSDALQFG